MGDYFDMISDNDGASLAWAGTFNGEEDVYYGRISQQPVAIDDGQKNIRIPKTFSLSQNYPNPFNPSTKIKFTIPSVIARETKQSQLVSLKVFDVLGNEIATLVNEEKQAGNYEVEFNSHSGTVRNLPSGIYFYTLTSGTFTQTKKMILLR
jgi:hypothetical protein